MEVVSGFKSRLYNDDSEATIVYACRVDGGTGGNCTIFRAGNFVECHCSSRTCAMRTLGFDGYYHSTNGLMKTNTSTTAAAGTYEDEDGPLCALRVEVGTDILVYLSRFLPGERASVKIP